jgi:hypothetical protein
MASGLITKQTDLKSLKYGSMPLGSDAPLITKEIGQAPGSQIGAEISHRIDDTSRIAQMLISKPGIKYLLHEAQLQQVNVADKIKNRGDKSVARAVLGQVGKTLVTTAKIAASTLAQVPVNGTGTHFVRGFKTDTYLTDGTTTKGFAAFFGAGGVEGAQYALNGGTVPNMVDNNYQNFGIQEGIDSFTIDPNIPTEYGYEKRYNDGLQNKPLPENVEQELSKTNAQNGDPVPVSVINGPDYDTTKAKGSLAGSKDNNSETLSTGSFVHANDDTKYLQQSGDSDQYNPENPLASTYLVQKQSVQTLNGNITKEKRVRLGDQGAVSVNADYNLARRKNLYWFASDPEKPINGAEVDKINALFPQDGKILGQGDTYEAQVLNGGQTAGRDLIKFRFHILTADGKEKVLYFRAFLDAFADNYTGAWTQVKYLGRAEDFQIYSGFQRKITLSFKIAAATRPEMEPLYQKMLWLASATAPTYASGGQFMRGTITKITVGDYIYELPGVLNSVNYTWNPEYPWEIAMQQPEGTEKGDFLQELPMVMDCQIEFTPIHTFTPTTGLKEYFTTKEPKEVAGRRGIPDIANENTGIEPVPQISAAEKAAAPVQPTQLDDVVIKKTKEEIQAANIANSFENFRNRGI